MDQLRQKSQIYLTICTFIFLLLGSFYFTFNVYLEGNNLDKLRIQKLTLKLEEKKLELALLKASKQDLDSNHQILNNPGKPAVTRSLASLHMKSKLNQNTDSNNLSNNPKNLAEFDRLIKEKKLAEAYKLLVQLKKSSSDLKMLARIDYEMMSLKCDKDQMSGQCLDKIESMVKKFPLSELTGLSLVRLAKIYHRLNKNDEIQKLILIFENDFAFSAKVQNEVKTLKRMIR